MCRNQQINFRCKHWQSMLNEMYFHEFPFYLIVMMAYGVAISDNIPKVFIRTGKFSDYWVIYFSSMLEHASTIGTQTFGESYIR